MKNESLTISELGSIFFTMFLLPLRLVAFGIFIRDLIHGIYGKNSIYRDGIEQPGPYILSPI